MTTTQSVDIRQSRKCFPVLLHASMLSALLIIPAQSMAMGDNEGVPLHGFIDVGYANSSKQSPDPKGFNMGSFDVYLTPQMNSNVKALVELVFETTAEGSVATDLERMQIGYTFNDNATVWWGRFHTPYGSWNTAFHHGAQMQTSVLRPRFLDFEDKGGILPAHMVGFWATGKVKAGNGKLTYDVFSGNGPKIAMGTDTLIPANQAPGTLDINIAGDNNHQAMVGFNFGYEFSGMADGLRLAVHSLRGDVDDDADLTFSATAKNKTELGMIGGSVVYLGNDWEILGEYYRFNNKDKSGTSGSHSSWADFLQIGRSFDSLTPYVRLEKTVLSQQDNYFSMQESGQSYFRQALGIKHDIDPKASLKFELLNSKFSAEPARNAYSYRSLYVQYAIRF